MRFSRYFRAGAVTVFLMLWMLGPTVLRLASFVQLLPQFDSLGDAWNLGRHVIMAGVLEDLPVAVEALLAVLLIKLLLSRTGPELSARLLVWSATGLFALVHVYLLFDFLLYAKTGIRMHPAFFDFLPVASSFVSSAGYLGAGGLALGLLVLAVVLRRWSRWFQACVGQLQFSWRLGLALPAVVGLALLGKAAMPPQLAYASDNRLLDDQWYLAASLLDSGKTIATDDRAAALRLLEPRAEQYRAVSPDYPLLKSTEGFTGPKQFDPRIEPHERPHVVLLFMESFRAADVGALGGKHNASPCFDRLARQGVLFTNFYSNSVQTGRAVIAGLFGILPCLTEKSVQGTNVDLPLIGVADLFHRRGYRNAYFNGASARFESQADFFARHGYDEIHTEEQILAANPAAKRNSWGYHDEYVLDATVRWLLQRDRQHQPALATVFTLSHHYPWELPEGYAAPDFDAGGNREYARFLRTFHYSDHCLGRFVARLKEAGLDRRTVLFVLGDHGAAQGEHHGNFMNVNYLYEETLRIPLLILAPGRLQRPAVVRDPASQVDLLPTIMDLFGMTGLNHAVGTSLVRRVENRVVYVNNPFGMQFAGLRTGDRKFVLALRPDAPYLFDLQSDPSERHNLAAEFTAECDRHASAVRGVNRLFLNLYLERRFTDRKAFPATNR